MVAAAALPWLNPWSAGPSPQVLQWLLSAACALLLWGLASTSAHLPRPPFVLPFAVVVAWAALSAAGVAPDIVFLAGGLAIMALAAAAAATSRVDVPLQWGLLAAAGGSALLGLAQYFGLAAALSPWVHAGEAGHAVANLRQPNQLATLCWLGLAVVLFAPLDLPAWSRRGMAVLMAAGCAATASRTGFLQLIVIGVLAGLWPDGRRGRLGLLGIATLAYFAVAAALPVLLELADGATRPRALWTRLAAGAGEGCISRRTLWSNVLQLVADSPWRGWGWGGLDRAHYLADYGTAARFCAIADNAHNLVLHLAVELGIPAAVVVIVASAAWALRRRPWSERDPLRRLAWCGLAVVGVHSLLEYPLWYGPFQVVSGTFAGWLLAAGPHASAGRPLGRAISGALLALLALALAYAAWDYWRVSQIYLPPGQRSAPGEALSEARRTWLFQGQGRFADVTLAQPGEVDPAWLYDQATRALAYSPEPRVIERVIASAELTDRRDEAAFHEARYRAAFPAEYRAWREARTRRSSPTSPRASPAASRRLSSCRGPPPCTCRRPSAGRR